MEELPIRLQARAVVINDLGEALLIRHEDAVPADPNEPDRLSYWVVPGGKLEEGESFADCAARETEEETGIGGLMLLRELPLIRKPLRYAEGMRMMVAHYFLFKCTGKPEPWLNDPGENITDVRWWSLEAIKTSGDHFLPESLFQDLPELIRTASLPSAG
jgi:ADP-ribose pyrophosphatase YjhB (NUDIX family)